MAEAQEKPPETWVFVVSAELQRVAAADAWYHISDYYNIHKWLPEVAECHKDDDAGDGEVVRVVVGAAGEEGKPLYWAKEVLTEKDETTLSLGYKLTDSDLGIRRYLAVMKVVPDAGGEGGCKIEWAVEIDPYPNCSLEDFIASYQSSLNAMAKRIEEFVVQNSISGA